MFALDAYPLQLGAAYVNSEITIASNTTYRRLFSQTLLFSLELIDIIVVYKFYNAIYMHAHPKSDCNHTPTPNSFADKTLSIPGAKYDQSK